MSKWVLGPGAVALGGQQARAVLTLTLVDGVDEPGDSPSQEHHSGESPSVRMNMNVALHMAMSAPVNWEHQSGGVDQEPEDEGPGLLHSYSSVSSSIKWQKYRCLLSLLTYSAYFTECLRGKHLMMSAA